MDIHLPLSQSRILASSGVALSHTGNTNETVLATVTIPGGAMGANGRLRITTTWTYPNSANIKTLRIRFGGPAGTEYCVNAPTTTTTNRIQHEIINRGAENSQVSGQSIAHFGFGTGAAALVTSAQNTANAVDLVFSAQLASAAETVRLEHYLVELIRP